MLETSDKPKKIDGFDRWDVEQWARTLRDVSELQSDDKKLKAATNQLKRDKAEAEKALNTLEVAEKNAKKNLKKVFGGKE